MDDSNFILFHWRNEFLTLKKNLSILKKQPDKKANHDIRVAIKKLRSFVKLLIRLTNKKDVEKHFATTEYLFNVLGRQRDVVICLELTRKFQDQTGDRYSFLKNYFEKNLEQTQSRSRTALKHYKKHELSSIERSVARVATFADTELLLEKISGWTLALLLQSKDQFKTPHKLRQDLKDCFHWIRMMPADHFLRSIEEKLHDILDDLGHWQDLQVFTVRTKHFRKDYLPKCIPDYEKIKKLEAISIENSAELLKTAIQKTRALIRTLQPADSNK